MIVIAITILMQKKKKMMIKIIKKVLILLTLPKLLTKTLNHIVTGSTLFNV